MWSREAVGVLLSAEASIWGISSGRNCSTPGHFQPCSAAQVQREGEESRWWGSHRAGMSGGWGKQGSRSLLGIARMLLK